MTNISNNPKGKMDKYLGMYREDDDNFTDEYKNDGLIGTGNTNLPTVKDVADKVENNTDILYQDFINRYYVDRLTGNQLPNPDYKISQYVNILNYNSITFYPNDITNIVFYTESFNFISSFQCSVKTTITVPVTAFYIRFSIKKYLPSIRIIFISKDINYILNDVNNLNRYEFGKGKIYCALGDSITYGFIPRNYTGYPGQLNSYAKLVADKNSWTFNNYGISGSTLAAVTLEDTTTNNPMVYRWNSMPDNADIITIMGGTNDVRVGIPLGVMSDRVANTYYGALHIICQSLIDKYFINQGTTKGKIKRIILLTPIKLLLSGNTLNTQLESYVNAIKEVAKYYSLPCIDLYNVSFITPHISQIIQGTEDGYTGMYNPYITDGTHPTQEGHEFISSIVDRNIRMYL